MIFKTKLELNHNMHLDYINPFTPNSIPFAMFMQTDYRSFGLFPRPSFRNPALQANFYYKILRGVNTFLKQTTS